MSLGILGGNSLGRQRGSMRGLGASTIPGTCWDKPGFKTCHAQQWDQARDDCNATGAVDFGGNVSKCIEVMTDAYVYNNCMEKYCPKEPLLSQPVKVGAVYASGDPCGSKNTIRFVQAVVGTDDDGKWGTNSDKAYQKYLASTGKDWYAIVPGCTGTGPYPRQVVTVVEPPPPVPEQIPPPAVVAPAKVSKAALMGGIALVSAIGIGGYYYGQKKGWF